MAHVLGMGCGAKLTLFEKHWTKSWNLILRDWFHYKEKKGIQIYQKKLHNILKRQSSFKGNNIKKWHFMLTALSLIGFAKSRGLAKVRSGATDFLPMEKWWHQPDTLNTKLMAKLRSNFNFHARTGQATSSSTTVFPNG